MANLPRPAKYFISTYLFSIHFLQNTKMHKRRNEMFANIRVRRRIFRHFGNKPWTIQVSCFQLWPEMTCLQIGPTPDERKAGIKQDILKAKCAVDASKTADITHTSEHFLADMG